MKTNLISGVLYGVLALASIECKQLPVEPTIVPNLLPNGSFENDGSPTLAGWRFGNPQLAQLVDEAPPGGGNWSLQLTADWAPTTGFVYAPVIGVNSGDIVKLSAFVRGTGRFGGTGIIRLAVGSTHDAQRSKSNSSNDTLWNQISVTDTLTLASGDTVWVVLSSPITELVPFEQLFDLVKVERMR